MTDPPTTPQPQARRWKRWAVGFALLCLLFATWHTLAENGELKRAGRVQLGQTLAEVRSIMRWETWSSWRPNKTIEYAYYGQAQSLRLELAHWTYRLTGRTIYRNRIDDWPIRIRFDANGRVDRIRRGSEVVERLDQ
jgi:hypothetical protein